MATKKIKTKDEERLDEAHLERVIALLENKGTKKEACEILNINYNTTRLDKLITVYKEKKATELRKREEKRGKPATEAEISFSISNYLEGRSIDSIANSLYRSTSFVNSILSTYGVPKRSSAYSYFSPPLIPEEAVREKFTANDVVYSARYDSLAKVISEFSPGVYLIFLKKEDLSHFAYQPTEELAALDHLKKYVHL